MGVNNKPLHTRRFSTCTSVYIVCLCRLFSLLLHTARFLFQSMPIFYPFFIQFEDGSSESGKRNRQYNAQKKEVERTNDDLQTLHIKLKIEDHEPR